MSNEPISNAMVSVMREDRVRILINAHWMEQNAKLLNYIKANDGVFVPVCDVKQYEDGNRPWTNGNGAK